MMSHHIITKCLLCLVLIPNICQLQSVSMVDANAGDNTPAISLNNENWVATDALERSLPSWKQVGTPRSAKYVGMFYFLWHGEHYDKAIHDITKLRRFNPASPVYGPESAFHWWGEPEAGYFRADDPWLIRRNLQLLTNAGVDVLFLDVTNTSTYLTTVRSLCQIAAQMRGQGIPTPSICFITYTKTAETVNDLYTNFYEPRQFEDLWFKWQGKPLILGKADDVTKQPQRDFFTWRYSWAWTNSRNEPRHWQWLDDSPQDYGWDQNPSVPEEIPVAVAGHPIRNVGKSNSRGKQMAASGRSLITPLTSQGKYFAEQWQRALSVNPSMVLVAGWNEWIAQRFIVKTDNDPNTPAFMGQKPKKGETLFVDLYNEEFNRDIEPMKGGYTDNYYYQLVANIRRFKGLRSIESIGKHDGIKIDGQFTDWSSVVPLYRDWPGDVAHRNWPRFDKKTNLTNKTGRNDFIEAKTAFTSQQVCFWVKTAQPITSDTGKNWMLLLINTDQQSRTGWHGYDLLVNRSPSTKKQTTVSRWQGGQWRTVSQATYRATGNQLEISVPRALFGSVKAPRFDFHWVDNARLDGGLAPLFTDGDSAPDRRFNYSFIGK